MNIIPFFSSVVFILSALFAGWTFYKATHRSFIVVIIMVAWVLLQSAISLTGFYTHTSGLPPRFLLLILPAIGCIVVLFLTPSGKSFIDGLDLKWLTLLHAVRIPVEIGLLSLYLHKLLPQLMTFEGRNFDILSGISSLLIWYFVFVKKGLSHRILLAWNFICLGLLLNIVINAILSAPFPFQQFGFDQPNIAVLYFPVILLPCLIVPLVLFSQLAAIRQLIRTGKINKMAMI